MLHEHRYMNNFQQRVQEYFDRALDQANEQDLLHKCEQDESCKRVFKKEEQFRNYFKNNLKRASIAPDFIQSIKDKIYPCSD